MQSKRISRATKLRVYRTAIKAVVTYAAETTRLTNEDEEQLRIYERRIIKKIYEPVKLGYNENL